MLSHNRFLLFTRLFALVVVAFSFSLWWLKPDIIELIIRQKPILLGAYSQAHFGALLLLTPLTWMVAAFIWFRTPLRIALAGGVLIVILLISVISVVTYGAYWFSKPRYIERVVDQDKASQLKLSGIVRHRPPNQRYQFDWTDAPERARSYPDAPSGYGTINIVLTSDEHGYRNPDAIAPFNVVVVGDSFAAGSHVSDHQGWSALMNQESRYSIYNLGVSGSGPATYLNNFAYYGLDKHARLVLFMIYEGNDFKPNSASRAKKSSNERDFELRTHLKMAFKGSPVTAGLRRLSEQVLERIGSDNPVPGYTEKVGWMPVRIAGDGWQHHYSFQPKRLLYLVGSKNSFAQSEPWQQTSKILERTVELAEQNSMIPVFIYVPSKPHVVMPLIEQQLDPDQLRNFAAYKTDQLPPPRQFKQQFYNNLDSQEQVFMNHCQSLDWHCLSLTNKLQNATAAGQQTYYTYDQHWTPEANLIAADAIGQYLDESGLL
jgi:hypothetical protein